MQLSSVSHYLILTMESSPTLLTMFLTMISGRLLYIHVTTILLHLLLDLLIFECVEIMESGLEVTQPVLELLSVRSIKDQHIKHFSKIIKIQGEKLANLALNLSM